MAQNQESQGDEFITPDGSDASSPIHRDCLDDSGDICAVCDGHGTIIVGEFDDEREVTCPRIVAAKKDRDFESAMDDYKQSRD